MHTLGIVGVPIITVENARATGTTAFHDATLAVESGRYERVLCVGVETMTDQFAGPIIPEATERAGATASRRSAKAAAWPTP